MDLEEEDKDDPQNLETFEKLWFIFLSWNCSFYSSSPFTMSRTSFISFLKRCKINKKHLPLTRAELLFSSTLSKKIMPIILDKDEKRDYGTRISLKFSGFCTLLFKVANIQNARHDWKCFERFVERRVVSNVKSYNIEEIQVRENNYRINKRLLRLVKCFSQSLKYIFEFYTFRKAESTFKTQSFSQKATAHSIDFQGYYLFYSQYHLQEVLASKRSISESFVEALHTSGLCFKTEIKMFGNTHLEEQDFLGYMNYKDTPGKLSFGQFLYALVRIADIGFSDESFAEKFMNSFGAKGYKSFLQKLNITKKEVKQRKLVTRPRSLSSKFMSRAVFDDILAVKFFFLLEIIVSRINFVELREKLTAAKSFMSFDLDIIRCNQCFEKSFRRVYQVLVFDFETALTMVSEDPHEIAHLRNVEADKRICLIATKLLCRSKKKDLDFLDMMKLCQGMRVVAYDKSQLNTIINQSWRQLRRNLSRDAKLLETAVQSSLTPGKTTRNPGLSKKKSHRIKRRSTDEGDTLPRGSFRMTTRKETHSLPDKEFALPQCDEAVPPESVEISSSPLRCMMNGAVLMKHGRRGSPHYRFFWYSQNKLFWRLPTEFELSLKLPGRRQLKRDFSNESGSTLNSPSSRKIKPVQRHERNLDLADLKSVISGGVRETKRQNSWFLNFFLSNGSTTLKDASPSSPKPLYQFTLQFSNRQLKLETDSLIQRRMWIEALDYVLEQKNPSNEKRAETDNTQ